MNFKLNGKAAEIRDEHPHLLAALREELGVTSPKDGCAPSGQCGCCLVLVDGRAVTSCTQSLARWKAKKFKPSKAFPRKSSIAMRALSLPPAPSNAASAHLGSSCARKRF